MTTESTLEDLRQLRSTTKGNITRIKNLVEAKSDSLSATELECRLGILESYFKQILACQTQIERLVPSDVCRGPCRRHSSVETTFAVPHVASNHLPNPKLPRFNGKYSEYKNFINSFTTLVDNEQNLSKIEKFNHLLTCLSDQALSTVKAFQVTEDNYPKALARLKDRYDNDCLIFLQYISELFEQPKVSKSSASELRGLVDNTSAVFNSLQSIGTFENICNAIVIYIAMSKVDHETQSKWDEHLDYKKLPTWSNCSEVLSRRCQYLEARESKQLKSHNDQRISSKQRPSYSGYRPQLSLAVSQKGCLFCRDIGHSITGCSAFNKLSVMDRFTNIKKLGLCLNCLGKGHSVSKCPSSYKCKFCKQPHHSLLHRPTQTQNTARDVEQSTQSVPVVTSNTALEREQPSIAQVILATALVLVKDSSGSFQIGRILLDSGSQVNFINEKFANSLNLKRQRKNVDIVGIGTAETKINFQTQTTIRSRYNNFETSLEFLVTPAITGYQPEAALNISSWNLPQNLELADEYFNKPSQIDLLLGAESFFDLLQTGQIKLGEGLPSLQKTSLGWIVSGRYKNPTNQNNTFCFVNSNGDSLEKYVEKFWELEQIQDQGSKWTEEQKECEVHFKENVEVLPSGRLMVCLPFKRDPSCLGASYNIAFRRFLALERRLANNPSLKAQYVEFLEEYQVLGHMSLIKDPKLGEPHYYLPHNCVVRPESTSTKLRVVFNASCCTSSHLSLNDTLMVGPTIQTELFIILLRFRLHRFQYILWRKDETTPVQTFQLNTITYGTSSAPFAAVRCLKYLAEANTNKFELGSRVIEEDFYVDDLITGDDDLDSLLRKQREVVAILNPAGLVLSKWMSNHPNIMEAASSFQKEIKLNEPGLTSTLGITWNPLEDEFSFSYNPNKNYSKYTKRSILSLSSSLFDPMGLLSPIIIRAKVILQNLWIEKIDWDASIPQSADTEWRQFMTDLHSLQNLSVPRFALIANRQSYQIHGFADASMHAYGCCIYLRAVDTSGSVQVRLLVAKSRVAPASRKQLPRLELCAAQLLAKLWEKIKPIFGGNYSDVYFWTDAAIVLHWIAMHSSKLTTFVANRVAEIQEKTKGVVWRHVPTDKNPADIVSRGCTVEELSTSMWFKGPQFLLGPMENWPIIFEISLSQEEFLLEKRKTVLIGTKSEPNFLLGIVERVSSYPKILRIFAYIIRFCRRKANPQTHLTVSELEEALLRIVKLIQIDSFSEEICSIKNQRSLKGSIKWLNPFLQETNGIELLRVGGRLKHANIPEETKHPLLLPKNSSFTKSLVRHLHISNYHAGPKALVSLIRNKFWIVNAREIARQTVRQCVHCVRYRPKLLEQVMGDLPPERLTSSRPFLYCGVDFCGPILTY